MFLSDNTAEDARPIQRVTSGLRYLSDDWMLPIDDWLIELRFYVPLHTK